VPPLVQIWAKNKVGLLIVSARPFKHPVQIGHSARCYRSPGARRARPKHPRRLGVGAALLRALGAPLRLARPTEAHTGVLAIACREAEAGTLTPGAERVLPAKVGESAEVGVGGHQGAAVLDCNRRMLRVGD